MYKSLLLIGEEGCVTKAREFSTFCFAVPTVEVEPKYKSSVLYSWSFVQEYATFILHCTFSFVNCNNNHSRRNRYARTSVRPFVGVSSVCLTAERWKGQSCLNRYRYFADTLRWATTRHRENYIYNTCAHVEFTTWQVVTLCVTLGGRRRWCGNKLEWKFSTCFLGMWECACNVLYI